jgi:LAS superfamily LD-carboxypeptidase LdcB
MKGHLNQEAGRLFEELILDDDFAEFLTIPAYKKFLNQEELYDERRKSQTIGRELEK